jgi:hypothetical protein
MKMWKDPELERMRVSSLKELDALVGMYLTKERPITYWEEQHAYFRFDSLEEAEDALNDPYFQHFLPTEKGRSAAFVEVREFPCYSSDLGAAWELVERLSGSVHALHVRCEKSRWIAAFGDLPAATAFSAPAAICLAALRAHGIEVDFVNDRASDARPKFAAA